MVASSPKPPPPPPLSSTSLVTANASLSAARSPHMSSGTDNVADSSGSHVISGSSSGEIVGAWSVFNPQYTPSTHSVQQAAVPPSPTPLASDFLYRRWLRCHIQLAGFVPVHPSHAPAAYLDASGQAIRPCSSSSSNSNARSIDYVPITDLTAQSFLERYDLPCRPCVLDNAMEDWPAGQPWSLPALSAAYGAAVLRVSRPGLASGTTRMQLAHYWDYAQRQAG
ncbi:hypothetical protein V8C86DRAFT_1026211 [Haematococcus lacustris]